MAGQFQGRHPGVSFQTLSSAAAALARLEAHSAAMDDGLVRDRGEGLVSVHQGDALAQEDRAQQAETAEDGGWRRLQRQGRAYIR